MTIEDFVRNINASNINDPYNWKIKLAARITKFAQHIKTRDVVIGKSACIGSHHRHHVYSKVLFPILPQYGIGTLRISVSQTKHEDLHRILAACKTYQDFVAYENMIKAENPTITANIADDYWKRIVELKTGIILYPAYVYFLVSEMIHKWLHARKVNRTLKKF